MNKTIKTYPKMLEEGVNDQKYVVVQIDDVELCEHLIELNLKNQTFNFPLSECNSIELKIQKLPLTKLDLENIRKWVDLVLEPLEPIVEIEENAKTEKEEDLN